MKKLLKYGVASLSLATLGVVATATDLPVLGTQVVHAEDATKDTALSFQMNGYDFSKDPDGFFIERLDDVVLYDIPIGQPYEFTFPNYEGYEFYRWFYYSSDEIVSGKSQTIRFDQVERDYGVMASYAKIQPSTDPVDGIDPKDPATDPADGGNADTGGGNSTGTGTQTPPANNNGGETGSQEQTPPTDNSTGGDTQTPPADAPKPQTLTVVETRQDENGAVLFTKTHSLVLNPGEEKDLGYNPDREVLVRGGNLYRYGNFEDGATLYFTTRLKPTTVDTGTPADKGAPTETPQPAPQADKEKLATTRNQLLAQVDQSRLTDAQKGELAVKIAFAETAEELDKLKADLTSLTAPASKPASASAAKPAPADQPAATTSAKTLPTTGELSTETLTAMGLSLVLFSLGLAKSRKTN